MKILNFIQGFSWASGVDEEERAAKICILDESFWVCRCEKTHVGDAKAFKGSISGELLNTGSHGLKKGEEVIFIPTLQHPKNE